MTLESGSFARQFMSSPMNTQMNTRWSSSISDFAGSVKGQKLV